MSLTVNPEPGPPTTTHSGRAAAALGRVPATSGGRETGMASRRLACCVASVVFLLGVVAAPAAGATSTLTRNPYLTDATATSVRVNWATASTATAKTVTWGPAG